MKRVFSLVSAMGLAATFAGAPSPVWAQTRPVKIGALLTLSGPLAAAGREIRDAVDLAAEDLNQRGGVRSLGGARIEIAYGDSQAKPDVATNETERLIDREQVLAVIDMYPSVTTLAASQVAERLKTPFYAAIAVADSITERGFKYVFEQVPRASDLGQFQVDFLDYLGKVSGTKFARVAIIHEDGDYGQAVSRGADAILKQRGYQVVGTFSYPFRTTDVSTMLAQVKAANPQAVIQASYIGDSILISRTASRLGLSVPFIDASGKAHDSYIKAVGKHGEGEFVLSLWNKDIPGAKGLNDKYRAKTGKDMPSHGALLYQGIVVLKQALEIAGKADRDALRAAIAKIDIAPGADLALPYERIQFNEKGLIVGGGFIMTQIVDGDFVTVWPEKDASAKPRPRS
jgi:branched-chain amino acid transport system substrate-binding protein